MPIEDIGARITLPEDGRAAVFQEIEKLIENTFIDLALKIANVVF
ncbi:hypothetical protein [Rhizobium skierniewicense]|nr:hypothetical protein [Rhizobium skierniewicense]